MTQAEYRQAVKRAQRVFGYIQIAVKERRPVRLSKTKALELLRRLPDDAQIDAEWADGDQAFLLVG